MMKSVNVNKMWWLFGGSIHNLKVYSELIVNIKI